MKRGTATDVHSSTQGAFSIWQGLDLPLWLRLLAKRPPLSSTKSLRLMLVSGLTVANSIGGLFEHLIYGRQIARATLPQDPVFILGHWRSGTTLLHNLLSLDPQFTYTNLYHILCPQHFLLTERVVPRLTSWLVPKTRPMDKMPLTWDSPQEDETALLNLTLCSPYLMLAFQGDREKYERFFDFSTASPAELERWKSAFRYLMKKITLKNQKTPLLKSPTHTYRIPLLLELFPNARFINIVRNPYAVFQSGVHLRRRLFEENALGTPNLQGIEEDVFVTYEHLFRCYEQHRKLIPPGRLHELRFEDLERDPLNELRQVYSTLQFEGFDELEPVLKRELASLRGYQKNEFKMDDGLKRQIYDRWQSTFQQYGYPHGFATQPAQVA